MVGERYYKGKERRQRSYGNLNLLLRKERPGGKEDKNHGFLRPYLLEITQSSFQITSQGKQPFK